MSILSIARVLLITAVFTVTLQAQDDSCEVSVVIPHLTSLPFSEISIPIYIDNVDTVVGFSIWLSTDRPGTVMAFLTDTVHLVDTVYCKCNAHSGPDCIDSTVVFADSTWDFFHIDTFASIYGKIDTAGTLLSGWEYVDARSLTSDGTDLLIVAIANLPSEPVTKGIGAQVGGTLIKVRAMVFDDNEPLTDSVVNILQNEPSFAVPNDTAAVVCFETGSVRVLPGYVCGDINNDGDVGNILDLTWVIDYAFRMGPPPLYIQTMDVNCDGAQNILDLTAIVDRIFRGGATLCNGGWCP